MIAIAFALLLTAQEPPEPNGYRECLTTSVQRLEPSQESAADVARAVIETCKALESGAEESSVGIRQVRLALREGFENRVLLQIVRIRACRRTSGCSIDALPDPYGRLQP